MVSITHLVLADDLVPADTTLASMLQVIFLNVFLQIQESFEDKNSVASDYAACGKLGTHYLLPVLNLV